ncbi:GNAT family protein [Roseovarius nubinhibens]|uniref:N-acetyltransferase n=1 Tax=Roseovarius nubinhibens TaxID=314263 RepID=A0A348WDJ5_9RHOB|nr:N-acetyltransferase [Roseovarius nubinhibens]|tara:strand:+ start:905 stop:1414 length:510 start_codon:yes stop_codon:yes gene_type:complete
MSQSLTALRPVAERDHPVLSELRQDVVLQRMLLGAAEPITEPVADWLTRRAAAGWIMTVTDAADTCLGYVQLFDRHDNNRTAWFGICLALQARGRGHGRAATLQTLEIARTEMNLRKVSLKVRADNPASRLYSRLGFRAVGTQRAEYDDGATLHDVVIMEYLFDGRSAA